MSISVADVTGIGSVASLAESVIGKIWPDKSAAEAAQLAAAVAIVQGQLDTNKVEAASPSAFVAGWRPFIGWVCGGAFAINYVIGPLAEWGANLAGHAIKFPVMDLSTMMPILIGMLGLGGMRTMEKLQGVPAEASLTK